MHSKLAVDAPNPAAYKLRERFSPRAGARAIAGRVSVGRLLEDKMANTPSAKKAARKIARRTAVNRSRRSQMRTFIRKVEDAIATGDTAAAKDALHNAEPLIMRAAQKGIVHKNAASRKVSRLAARVNGLAPRASA